jgi:UDP-GlcNAc:undecaprenyl-phosphate/decaprenyl-phosphate GlcNAc-1-phosphate transferase
MPFLIAFLIGLVLTPIGRWAGERLGLVDRPGDPLKIHSRPVSVLGGVSVVTAASIALVIVTEVPGAVVAGGVVVALVSGLIDDLRLLGTRFHVLLQVAVGVILVAGGIHLAPLGPMSELGTVVLVVVCMNAVNLVDGQDGLAGGLAAIAALALAAIAALTGSTAAGGLVLAGSLSAFLVWNRPPARIFLGNGGAYAVGACLAILAASATEDAGWRGLVAALVCLGIFLFDLAFTVARRSASRRLTAGDRLHSYDLVSLQLGNRGKATLAFLGIGALSGSLAVAIVLLPLIPAAAVVALAAAAGVVCGQWLWDRRGAITRTGWIEAGHVMGDASSARVRPVTPRSRSSSAGAVSTGAASTREVDEAARLAQ